MNKLYTGGGTSNETDTEQALVPYINNTNIPNISNDLKIVNLVEQAKKFENYDVIASKEAILKNETAKQKEKSSAKKEKVIAPKIEEVKSYFLNQNFPELEAIKFFNYFSSNGWLVGVKHQWPIGKPQHKIGF